MNVEISGTIKARRFSIQILGTLAQRLNSKVRHEIIFMEMKSSVEINILKEILEGRRYNYP